MPGPIIPAVEMVVGRRGDGFRDFARNDGACVPSEPKPTRPGRVAEIQVRQECRRPPRYAASAGAFVGANRP
ncbi:hypothetical protein GCM10008170_06960 [Methylopila capsulata]|uniref:Uncharacterized protein n=1 Tax=Methylopila capsulata TaxID=61654 RepID=A0A9W6IQJ4_9HYPH|nr:hypothetical protein GCM10008170_06960 [Methylopila capsulata]